MKLAHKIAAAAVCICIVVITIGAWVLIAQDTGHKTTQVYSPPHETKKQENEVRSPNPEQIQGTPARTDEKFSILVPHGWSASVSTQPQFIALQYARPGKLESLVYDPQKSAVIDYNGIPAWSGLTEHFYVRYITDPSQAFDPSDHLEVSMDSFTFNDGTVGKLYSVTKHEAEARKWGGLLKDAVWNGRVFLYQKDGKTIEAHLAWYASTNIDDEFYKSVAKTIRL